MIDGPAAVPRAAATGGLALEFVGVKRNLTECGPV